MILKYIGYKILDGLYMLFIGVENIVANAKKSLGQIVDYKRIDKRYNIDTQLISDSTYIPACQTCVRSPEKYSQFSCCTFKYLKICSH